MFVGKFIRPLSHFSDLSLMLMNERFNNYALPSGPNLWLNS